MENEEINGMEAKGLMEWKKRVRKKKKTTMEWNSRGDDDDDCRNYCSGRRD